MPALDDLEDEYFLYKMLGYVNTILVQSTQRHLELRQRLVKSVTKRLNPSTSSRNLHRLIRQINRLVVLPE